MTEFYGIVLHRKDGATESTTIEAENLTQAWIKAGKMMATGKYKYVEQIILPRPVGSRAEPLDADEFNEL